MNIYNNKKDISYLTTQTESPGDMEHITLEWVAL